MVDPYSEFFISKPVAKNNERVAKGLIYLSSRFKSIIPKRDKNKTVDGFDLKEVWRQVVGSNIGDISFPSRITKEGILNITVQNSSIIPYVRYNSEKIMKDINLFFGKEIVKKISIKNLKE